MDFSGIAWWAYLVGAVAGAGFGVLQSMLLRSAMLAEPPRKWLYAVKYVLWAAALTVMALISVPLLLVFAVAASITLIVGSALLYRKVQREAR